MEKILQLIDDFRLSYKDINIELIIRETEPKFVIKVFDNISSIFVAIYLSENEVNEMSKTEFAEYIIFSIQQEEKRRLVVKQNVFQNKSS